MLLEMKCTITKNNVLLESLAQTTDFDHFSESLDKFEAQLNTVITKLINEAGDSGGDCHTDEESDDSVDEEVHDQISPKKKKK